MKDIRDFVEIHGRMQGAPPDLPACLQEVWKRLQRFSMEDPLSFYELAISVRAMFTYTSAHKKLEEEADGVRRPALVVPLSPWRERIVSQGFASQGDGDTAHQHFEVHEVVRALFEDHLIPKPPPREATPPPVMPVARKPARVAKFTLKKKTRQKKK